MINHLIRIKDPVIENFQQAELNPIMVENAYHSPEVSEVEEEEVSELVLLKKTDLIGSDLNLICQIRSNQIYLICSSNSVQKNFEPIRSVQISLNLIKIRSVQIQSNQN